jgi:hypothetical protein
MSLVGFQARNHPQQVDKRGPKLHVDDRPPFGLALLIWSEASCG